MDYARTVLNLPVPEVIAYSARADSTLVGVEFVLMRRSPGSELRKRWDGMSSEHVSGVIDQVLGAESRFMRYEFSQIGSLYYIEDVEPTLRARPLYKNGAGSEPGAGRFRIGPSTEWALWRGARAGLDVDRGPCEFRCNFHRRHGINRISRAGRSFVHQRRCTNPSGLVDK